MTSKAFDWAAFFQSMEEAAEALKANRPLPAGGLLSVADAVAVMKTVQPRLAEADAWLAGNPGVITAGVRLLLGLEAQGVPWAQGLSSALASAPGGLKALESVIPQLIAAVNMFTPAPDWQPGPGPFRGR